MEIIINKRFRLLSASLALSCLPACAPLASLIGYSGPAVQVAVLFDRAKLLSDGVSYVGSGKTITDHTVSIIAGADCRVLNLATVDPVCKPTPGPATGSAEVRVQVAAISGDLLGTDASAPIRLRVAAEEMNEAASEPVVGDATSDQ